MGHVQERAHKSLVHTHVDRDRAGRPPGKVTNRKFQISRPLIELGVCDALTNVTPVAGSVSVTITPVALDGPLFLISNV